MGQPFNPLNHPIIFSDPERLTQIPSWHEHIPFAMFLIATLKPRLFVELGTLYGDSYCAFCQAVKMLSLDTRCYAIDTWQGDDHASYEFTEALPDLQVHHDQRYSSFSTLLQSTFDDALPLFQAGSIDLLHIDGFHSYEAVKHDFETWQPKLSERGVVVFHDTNVLERGFGVRQFWDELRPNYPHFEFTHGNGLGVLAVGQVEAPELQAFFQASPLDVAGLRNLFHRLGNRLTLKYQTQHLTAELAQARQDLAQAEAAQAEAEKLAATAQEAETALSTNVTHLSTQLDDIVRSRAWKLVQALWWTRRGMRS